MKLHKKILFIVLIVSLGSILSVHAKEGAFPVEEGFLSADLDQFKMVVEEEHGLDLVYGTPEKLVRMGKFTSVMIDQPEIWLDKDSKYRGMKPDNAKAVADLIRESLTYRIKNRGYEVVHEPGPDVLYMRVGLTDLYLKKEKRRLLAYTPVGAVAKLGVDAVRDMMDKVDIIEMALQVELLDSQSEEVMAAIVIKRGARKDKKTGQREERMEFDEFKVILSKYGGRLACRLENSKVPESKQINCTDDKALEAAGYFDVDD